MEELRAAALDVVASPTILSSMLAVQAWAARALAADVQNNSAFVALRETALKIAEVLESKRGDPAGDRLVRALIRADTLAAYSRLCSRTLVPPRGAAARRSVLERQTMRLLLVMLVVKDLNDFVLHVKESPDDELGLELVAALVRTQVLEHTARLLLHVAKVDPAAPAGSADRKASVWLTVTKFSGTLMCLTTWNLHFTALSRRPREKDVMCLAMDPSTRHQTCLLEQVRPLLAGRCVQLFAAWAGLLAAVVAQQQQQKAGDEGSGKQSPACTGSPLWHKLPPALVRPPLDPAVCSMELADLSNVAAEVRVRVCVRACMRACRCESIREGNTQDSVCDAV